MNNNKKQMKYFIQCKLDWPAIGSLKTVYVVQDRKEKDLGTFETHEDAQNFIDSLENPKQSDNFEGSMKDNINPNHYKQGKVECIDAIESATINKKGIIATDTGNVIKYLWRCEDKNGKEDLIKAKWYIEDMIERWDEYYPKQK